MLHASWPDRRDQLILSKPSCQYRPILPREYIKTPAIAKLEDSGLVFVLL